MRLAAAQTFTKLVLSMYNPIKVWGHGGPVKDIYVVSLKTAMSISQCVHAHCPDEKLMHCLVSAAVSMMPTQAAERGLYTTGKLRFLTKS